MKDYLKHRIRHNYFLTSKIRQVQRLHEMDQHELATFEDAAFLKLFRHSYNSSKFYNSLYREAGINLSDIKSKADIIKLPVIDKRIVRENIRGILTTSSLFTVKGYTSGTSGSPLTVYRSFDSVITENAYLCNFKQMHGISQSEKVVSLRGDLNRDALHKFDRYSNTLFLSSFNINEQTIHLYIKLIREFEPKCVLGYPSSLELFSNELAKADCKLNIPIAITSSETLYDFQREKIEKFIGARVFDWYGNAERTIAVEQCANGNYYFVPGYSINERGDDSIVTTSLINFTFPLIRYEVNDSIDWTTSQIDISQRPATCLVSKIEGRIDDFICLPGGGKIGRIDIAFKGVNDILYAQIIQEDISSIQVNVVPLNDRFDEGKICLNLRKLLGDTIKINMSSVTPVDIIKTKSGKFKLVINRISDKTI